MAQATVFGRLFKSGGGSESGISPQAKPIASVCRTVQKNVQGVVNLDLQVPPQTVICNKSNCSFSERMTMGLLAFLLKWFQYLSSFWQKMYHYEEDTGMRLARLCKICYAESAEDLFEWRYPTCMRYLGNFIAEDIVVNEQTGGRAVVGFDPDMNAVVVAFRGNSNRENWLNSLNVDKVPPTTIVANPEAGEVHEGFLVIYESLRRAVLDAVAEVLADHPDAEFRFAGHSMGGTQAILLAVDVRLTYPNKDVVVYNYGSPRVGDSTFAQYYNQLCPKTVRVVHAADPVTIVPPSAWPFQYKHVGRSYLDVSKIFSHRIYLSVHLTKVGQPVGVDGEESASLNDVTDEGEEDDELDVHIKLNRTSSQAHLDILALKHAQQHTKTFRRKDSTQVTERTIEERPVEKQLTEEQPTEKQLSDEQPTETEEATAS